MKIMRKILMLTVFVLFGVALTSCVVPGTVTYTVTINTNGGNEIEALKVETQTTVPSITDPVKEGYDFVGWYTDAECTAKYDFSTKVTSDFTLFAKWEKIVTYTITFDSKGGSEVESQTVREGKTVQIPETPVLEGYYFIAWVNARTQEVYDFATPVTGNVSLYATWELKYVPVDSYVISFDSNGGSTVPSQAVEEGKTVAEPTAPTKARYEFVGWYTDTELSNEYDFATPVTGELTLYAKWEEIEYPEYTITFNSNGGSVVSEQVVEQGLTVTRPADPVLANNEFQGWYTDSACTIAYDFTQPVSSDLTLYAKWYQYITYSIRTVAQNANLVAFNSDKQGNANSQAEFFDLTVSYKVGDDNNWVFKPNVTFRENNLKDDSFEYVTNIAWNYVVTLYENGVDVTDSQAVEAIDKVNCTINFSDEAIGHTYTIQVYPEGLTEAQKTQIQNFTASFEFTVVDGYNAYSALELAYIENRNQVYSTGSYGTLLDSFWDGEDEEEAAAWNEFKIAHKLDPNYAPSCIILHSDINITPEDVPSMFFYTHEDLMEGLSTKPSDYDTTLGSMKDTIDFYERINVGNTKHFTLEGNYFQISTEYLREVTREWGEITEAGKYVISHSALFTFTGHKDSVSRIRNTDLRGNAPRTDDKIKAGGLILTKSNIVGAEMYNNIASSFFISYFPELTDQLYEINKCKCYDSFNSFVYNWASPNVQIIDSEMIGAGGPVIIQDYLPEDHKAGEHIGQTQIKGNCNLQSYVQGTEGWFTVVGASSLVEPIRSFNALFATGSKTYLTTSKLDANIKYFNLISVNKSGTAQTFTTEKIKGSVAIEGCAPFDFGASFAANTSDPYAPVLATFLDTTYSNSAPAFQSSAATSATGFGYYNPDVSSTNLIDPVTQGPITDSKHKIFEGDYLGLYYSGMCIVLGYTSVYADV